MENTISYKRYRWFITSEGNYVVGGKSAVQNDELIPKVKSLKKELYVMHTSAPGSPFCIILSPMEKVTPKELEECAIFTGCFSQAWKAGKKKALIDIFPISQLTKEKGMKQGTWGVFGKVKQKAVDLSLVLTKQKDVFRAIPESAAKGKEFLVKFCPGSIAKKDFLTKLELELDVPFNQEELMSALPAGGFRICR